LKSLTLKIQGMHCGGCAETVKASLEREPGVKAASVAFESGEARVLYDPLAVREDRLAAVVQGLGYRVVARER
jgi:copper chaperone CopZ